MNKKLKSLLTSAAIIFIYVFATLGIVRLFWNTDNMDKFESRAMFVGIMLIIFSLVFIVGIYHIVGAHRVENYYTGLMIFHVLYLIVGLLVFLFMPEKH